MVYYPDTRTFYYLDTSALVKRYVLEAGSNWVIQRFLSPDILFCCQIANVELTSAIVRRMRQGSLTPHQANLILQTFRQEWESRLEVVLITDHLLEEAVRLVEKHFLRAYDSIQLAGATTLQRSLKEHGIDHSLIFVSADEELNMSAKAEGLAVLNPLHES